MPPIKPELQRESQRSYETGQLGSGITFSRCKVPRLKVFVIKSQNYEKCRALMRVSQHKGFSKGVIPAVMVTADRSRLYFHQGNVCQNSFEVSSLSNLPTAYTEALPDVALSLVNGTLI